MASTTISPVPAQIEQGHSPVPLHAPQSSTIPSGRSVPVTVYEPAPSQARHGTRPSKQCLHSCVTGNFPPRRAIGRWSQKRRHIITANQSPACIPDEMDFQEATFSAFLPFSATTWVGFLFWNNGGSPGVPAAMSTVKPPRWWSDAASRRFITSAWGVRTSGCTRNRFPTIRSPFRASSHRTEQPA